MSNSLLIELRTEELPPKSLKALSESFAGSVFAALKEQAFASTDSVCTIYATPRRLALLITDVAGKAGLVSKPPLAILGEMANGSLIERQGRIVGSALIGQQFTGAQYFHGRPSVTMAPDPQQDGASIPAPYNAGLSGASNQGVTHQDLSAAVAQRVAQYRADNGLAADAAVPVDAVTASASGLDPHISLANALLQLPRVAQARQLPPERVQVLMEQATAPRSLARRSAQTALYQITHAMLRWMAPFLSFTAEEAWKVFGKSETIFVEKFWDFGATEAALLDKWDRIRAAREVVNKEIEALRADGRVGASLQAEVTVTASGELLEALRSLGEDLKFVFITSAATLAEGEALAASVTPSSHAKCERCWHYREDVGQDAAHPTICGRCTSNLHGTGENRVCA